MTPCWKWWQTDFQQGSNVLVISFVNPPRRFWNVFSCLSGIDASAQTTSHEMTIPNDVSDSYHHGQFTTVFRHFTVYTLEDVTLL